MSLAQLAQHPVCLQRELRGKIPVSSLQEETCSEKVVVLKTFLESSIKRKVVLLLRVVHCRSAVCVISLPLAIARAAFCLMSNSFILRNILFAFLLSVD